MNYFIRGIRDKAEFEPGPSFHQHPCCLLLNSVWSMLFCLGIASLLYRKRMRRTLICVLTFLLRMSQCQNDSLLLKFPLVPLPPAWNSSWAIHLQTAGHRLLSYSEEWGRWWPLWTLPQTVKGSPIQRQRSREETAGTLAEICEVRCRKIHEYRSWELTLLLCKAMVGPHLECSVQFWSHCSRCC